MKSGKETITFSGSGTGYWTNPDGTSGRDAKAVSNVQICVLEKVAEPVQ